MSWLSKIVDTVIPVKTIKNFANQATSITNLPSGPSQAEIDAAAAAAAAKYNADMATHVWSRLTGGEISYGDLTADERNNLMNHGYSDQLGLLKKEWDNKASIDQAMKNISDQPFKYEDKQFEYGGLNPEQQKYLDLLTEQTQKQLTESQGQLANTQVARGMGRSGMAVRQSNDLHNQYMNQLGQQNYGYKKGLQEESYQRFLSDQMQGYGRATDEYQRNLSNMMTGLGLNTDQRNQIWGEQNSRLANSQQLYMQRLQNEWQASQSAAERANQLQMQNKQIDAAGNPYLMKLMPSINLGYSAGGG
jgi:hypothetical protein